MKPKFDFDDLYDDLMEHQQNLTEAEDNKTQAIIKELIDTSFGGSNESQMKAVQLLKGLAVSDDPAANAFMKKLDKLTSGMKSEKSKPGLDESIKSDITQLKADKMERKGKLVTLTWKSGDPDEIKKNLVAALKANEDKIKTINTKQDGAGVKAHIEMN